MAVTITLGQLANQVRLSVSTLTVDVPDGYGTILTTNLAAATAMVEARAPAAPEKSQNKAVVQIVGYWLDTEPASAQRFGYNAWLHSGAAQILAPFIERRAEPV